MKNFPAKFINAHCPPDLYHEIIQFRFGMISPGNTASGIT